MGIMTEDLKIDIRRLHAMGYSEDYIAKKYNLTIQQVHKVINPRD